MYFKIILICIVILASCLRLWNLPNFPAGFNADEASIGYNAYSLLQTGKDEYGDPWPITFKSFGDYKPGFYFYLVLPFVSLLGLNEWAVRLPSAFLGIGTVVLIFFLAKEIFQNRVVGLLSALFLAISPWHIHFSKGGWETNAATFFIVLGTYLFIKGLKNSNLLFFSGFSLLLSMYTYQTPRIVVPVMVIILALLYQSELIFLFKKTGIRKTMLVLFSLFILTIPLVLQFTSRTATARFTGLSFLGDVGPLSRINELRGEHNNLNDLSAKLIHNKITAYVPNFLGHYFDHFKPDFLFINGDPLIRNKIPETGQFYLIQALCIAAGLLFVIKAKLPHTRLLISWILVAPLASSMTYQTPHALRALNMVVPLIMVTAYGLWAMMNYLKLKIKIIFLLFVIVFLVFEFFHYLESYYIHYPKRYSLSWEYGFKEMVEKLEKYESNYQKIVITDRYDQPYILVLFYKKYDPEKYQPQANLSPRDKFNFGTIRNFDNYQFRSIEPKEISLAEKTLFIGTPDEIPEDANIIDEVRFPNGKPAFLFVSKI